MFKGHGHGAFWGDDENVLELVVMGPAFRKYPRKRCKVNFGRAPSVVFEFRAVEISGKEAGELICWRSRWREVRAEETREVIRSQTELGTVFCMQWS